MGLRVLLIDDHTLFRVGLEGLLAHRNIEVIASIGDGHEGLKGSPPSVRNRILI